MKILGLETSCDETSASIVEDGVKILSNIVASSQPIHAKTNGIIPEMAAREQIRCIIPVIDAAMSNVNPPAGGQMSNLDAIAVTVGPGLIGSLLVGVETAKTLAYIWNKPIIPVNHLLAHVYANWITNSKLKTRNSKLQFKSQNLPEFPAIVLIVSGGHTELLFMTNHGKYEWLGATRDDAAGECFDKCARLLKLGYPGGPAISAAAEKLKTDNMEHKTWNIKLPRPMLDSEDFDFSFSGLKTAVLRETQHLELNTQNQSIKSSVLSALAYEVQEAITDILVEKTLRAVKKYKVKSLLLSGGVAANDRLREKFLNTCYLLPATKFFAPPKNLCTDNAAAVASCAYFNFAPLPWPKLHALPSLSL